jgi:hypothetical protein
MERILFIWAARDSGNDQVATRFIISLWDFIITFCHGRSEMIGH